MGESIAPYVAPFAALIALLGLGGAVGLPAEWAYPVRTVIVIAVLLYFSRSVIQLRPQRPLLSVVVGVAVFALWVAPDVLWPGYRQHWLFSNRILGTFSPTASSPTAVWFLFFRVTGAALLVPIVEELFWRNWLMRRLISHEFWNVPLGAYTRSAFWISALLFASEHGSYWDVGLGAGVIYNAWMVRTRSLADCILAHAVTNGALAAYVIATRQWSYWA